MQKLKKLAAGSCSLLFGLLLLFIVLITSFEAVCYWTPGLYAAEFSRYQVLEDLEYWTGDRMDAEGLQEVMDQTMSYLRGNRENLIVTVPINGRDTEFYNETEKSHMADVRVLFVQCIMLRSLAVLAALALAGMVIIWTHRRAFWYLARGYVQCCRGVLCAAALLGIGCLINFTGMFTLFHRIFFSQGNWMFDPRQSRMICIMPEGFFSDIALRIALTFLGTVLALLLSALWVKHGGEKDRKEQNDRA